MFYQLRNAIVTISAVVSKIIAKLRIAIFGKCKSKERPQEGNTSGIQQNETYRHLIGIISSLKLLQISGENLKQVTWKI